MQYYCMRLTLVNNLCAFENNLNYLIIEFNSLYLSNRPSLAMSQSDLLQTEKIIFFGSVERNALISIL